MWATKDANLEFVCGHSPPLAASRREVAAPAEGAASTRKNHGLQALVVADTQRHVRDFLLHRNIQGVPGFRTIHRHDSNLVFNVICDGFVAHCILHSVESLALIALGIGART